MRIEKIGEVDSELDGSFYNIPSQAQQNDSIAGISSILYSLIFPIRSIHTEIITCRVSVETYPIHIINIMKI